MGGRSQFAVATTRDRDGPWRYDDGLWWVVKIVVLAAA